MMNENGKPGRAGATNAAFPTSCWTVILTLKPGDDGSIEHRALEVLCERYWFPLYAFARHRGMTSHDAEDAVQSFFLTIGKADYFRKASHEKGKLRTFILTGFTRHLKDLKVHQAAQKRGGGVAPVSIDTDQAEEWLLLDPKSVSEDAPLKFEQHWARNIMRTVIEVLRQQAAGNEKSETRFALLSRFLDAGASGELTIRDAAEELEMTLSACEKAVQRLRHQFRLAVREQVAATLQNPDEDAIMAEMQQLQRALVQA